MLFRNFLRGFVFSLILSLTLSFVFAAHAQLAEQMTQPNGKYFNRAIFVVLENTNYSSAIKQPFLKYLADNGALFSNFMAVTHPSQGNYVALTSGALNGVLSDSTYDLNVVNIVDLLEAKGLTWKIYAEDYPGRCFTGASNKDYVRKHNPFISYINIQKNPTRCANIVDAAEFDRDATSGTLPNYVFYVPNLVNDGHNTNSTYADKWYSQKFSTYINNPQFMADTVLITAFDESENLFGRNQIYTSIYGPNVKPQTVTARLNLYSLLHLVESNWDLGNLGKQDATATPMPNIWR